MNRFSPEGAIPLICCEGTAFECGEQLGVAWQAALRENAARARGRWTPWWWKGRGGPAGDLVEKVAPHLVDLFRGMAKAARVEEALCGYAPIAAPLEECTSFGICRDLTVDGHGISGQTKDTGRDRTFLYQVLRLKMKDAPGYLTLTYPGELFGHGFTETGMSVFRNSLYASPAEQSGELPYDAFGLLTLFSHSIEEAAEIGRRYGVRIVGHICVSEASGRTVGFEMAYGPIEVVEGREGIYVHANHVVSPRLAPLVTEKDRQAACLGASEHREKRLYELLESERGRLTPQILLHHLADHANYPASICHHRSRESHTTAAVVAEPTRGLLHVTRGNPCQNWPTTYRL